MKLRRIPAGHEIIGRRERWSLFLYKAPFVGWNGRRIVWRWRGPSLTRLLAAVLAPGWRR